MKLLDIFTILGIINLIFFIIGCILFRVVFYNNAVERAFLKENWERCSIWIYTWIIITFVWSVMLISF
jgi:hypothetical protein